MDKDKYTIKNSIKITKNDISNRYKNMDNYFKSCIEVLYGDEIEGIEKNEFRSSDIVEALEKNKKKRVKNGYDFLNNLKSKTGIYIFLDNGIPVYIGVGGTKKTDDLKIRVKKECKIYGETKDKSGTLSKNIKDIESKLGNKDKVKTFEKIRNIIKSFKIIVISVGYMLKDDKKTRDLTNINKAKALETILIALFHPKYNK